MAIPLLTRKPLLIVFGSALVLLADDRSNRTLSASRTEHFNVPAAASIRLENSFGEIDIDGWDRPEVEVTVTKSIEQLSTEPSRARAQQRLDSVQITVKQNEGDTLVSTVYPERRGLSHLFSRRGDVGISYRIHAPRAAKLIIDQKNGGLNIAGMSGDIHSTVGDGQITLSLADSQFAIDAKCKIGKVYSDFDGHDQRRHLFGEDFSRESSKPPNLYLRAGFGDIIILKATGPPQHAE
jgi:hypothetical protein